MDQDVLGYSSHDWRKHTDDAVVVDHKTKMKVNPNHMLVTSNGGEMRERNQKHARSLQPVR